MRPFSRPYKTIIPTPNVVRLFPTMENIFSYSTKKIKHLIHSSFSKFLSVLVSSFNFVNTYLRILVSRLNPFSAHLFYFISVSLVGFLAWKVSNPNIKGLDLFFTSVSAATVSSMSTVEMEVFSNPQLLIITFLMLVGGEVFISMIGLHFMNFKFKKINSIKNQVGSVGYELESPTLESSLNGVEMGLVLDHPNIDGQKPNISLELGRFSLGNEDLKCKSIKCLTRVILFYHLASHIFGSTLVSIYVSLVSNARQVLKKKGIDIQIFSIFLAVSTFANCGFTPTNENMTVFSKNPGLLLILIPQILLGNALFAPCLHFLIRILEKFTKREEFRYLLRNHKQVGFGHLLSKIHSLCIVGTALGIILVQFIFFCSLEWNSEITNGLTFYEKLVGSLFQVVNTRHTGESVFDISIASPAILVMFVVMMYLPSYASVRPFEEFTEISRNRRKITKENSKFVDYISFSQLSYLVICIILICVTEEDKMKTDPLNFNVLNITLEVISAYGNVGFSTGYSCKKRLDYDSQCKDTAYGFVGRWSDKGKIILIIVMLFGRLKNFTKKCGKAWSY